MKRIQQKKWALWITIIAMIGISSMVLLRTKLPFLRASFTGGTTVNGTTVYLRIDNPLTSSFNVYANQQVILQCANQTLPAGMRWATPNDFPGLKIYEYSPGGALEKVSGNQQWNGAIAGYTSRPATLTTFKQGRTYFLKATGDIAGVGCAVPMTSSSSSSSSSRLSSSSTSSASSESAYPSNATLYTNIGIIKNSGATINPLIKTSGTIALDPQNGILFQNNGLCVGKVDVKSGRSFCVISTPEPIWDIAVDPLEKKIYTVTASTANGVHEIRRYNFDGLQERYLVNGMWGPINNFILREDDNSVYYSAHAPHGSGSQVAIIRAQAGSGSLHTDLLYSALFNYPVYIVGLARDNQSDDVYWMERRVIGQKNIWHLMRLKASENTAESIFSAENPIETPDTWKDLRIDPINRDIYWMKQSPHGNHTLMKMNLNNRQVSQSDVLFSSLSAVDPNDSMGIFRNTNSISKAEWGSRIYFGASDGRIYTFNIPGNSISRSSFVLDGKPMALAMGKDRKTLYALVELSQPQSINLYATLRLFKVDLLNGTKEPVGDTFLPPTQSAIYQYGSSTLQLGMRLFVDEETLLASVVVKTPLLDSGYAVSDPTKLTFSVYNISLQTGQIQQVSMPRAEKDPLPIYHNAERKFIWTDGTSFFSTTTQLSNKNIFLTPSKSNPNAKIGQFFMRDGQLFFEFTERYNNLLYCRLQKALVTEDFSQTACLSQNFIIPDENPANMYIPGKEFWGQCYNDICDPINLKIEPMTMLGNDITMQKTVIYENQTITFPTFHYTTEYNDFGPVTACIETYENNQACFTPPSS